jgi:hypothetical protein
MHDLTEQASNEMNGAKVMLMIAQLLRGHGGRMRRQT